VLSITKLLLKIGLERDVLFGMDYRIRLIFGQVASSSYEALFMLR